MSIRTLDQAELGSLGAATRRTESAAAPARLQRRLGFGHLPFVSVGAIIGSAASSRRSSPCRPRGRRRSSPG